MLVREPVFLPGFADLVTTLSKQMLKNPGAYVESLLPPGGSASTRSASPADTPGKRQSTGSFFSLHRVELVVNT